MSFERCSRKAISILLTLIVIIGCGDLARHACAQAQKAHRTQKMQKADEYHRPDPQHPGKPQIPSANRYRTNIVFLEQADSLYRPLRADEEMQVVKGNVRFRQAGLWMYCDSAYYYPDRNSLDAFSNVKMQQGDTLFVYADQLDYDGSVRFARLRCGPTRSQVLLENRDVKLNTDSLDYDLATDLGWYQNGGKLEDKQNILTSVYGNYSPSTKNAEFYNSVVLRSKDNKFEMITDTLYYNTDTHIARIETLTEIRSDNDTIFTTKGLYNTETGIAELLARSTIMHRDSLNRVTTMVGDSIVYDPETRITRAYTFRDPAKIPTPMVITDTARKAILIGGFGIYNDSTREAMATEYPLMMEFSRPDTIYLRADTIRTWLVNRAVPDRQRTDSIPVTLIDSITGDSIITLQPRIVIDSITKEFHLARAYPRARFFRRDMQGIADTIMFTEYDSILNMTRLPIVWSDERQIKGDTITVHFNDSTADWARLPHKGLMMEEVEEDFYNQLSADRMMLYLDGDGLRRLEGEGSVMTIFLPMEKDSTYSRFVYAESSYMDVDLTNGQLDRLKMWPEVSGTVTPVGDVKNSQKLLPKAEWFGYLRPRREWYGERLHWADDLGEIPDELERYFSGN
ncbi:MAG: hypothetical protein K2H86_06180 [Muribaculaceae bacterium]|nr:hypothetical protein [Muribaculaceae bacterium]